MTIFWVNVVRCFQAKTLPEVEKATDVQKKHFSHVLMYIEVPVLYVDHATLWSELKACAWPQTAHRLHLKFIFDRNTGDFQLNSTLGRAPDSRRSCCCGRRRWMPTRPAEQGSTALTLTLISAVCNRFGSKICLSASKLCALSRKTQSFIVTSPPQDLSKDASPPPHCEDTNLDFMRFMRHLTGLENSPYFVASDPPRIRSQHKKSSPAQRRIHFSWRLIIFGESTAKRLEWIKHLSFQEEGMEAFGTHI